VLSLLPALACAVLALVPLVVPGSSAAARLAPLRHRSTAAAHPRLVPAAVVVIGATAVGLLALGPAGALAGGGAAAVWRRRRARSREARTTAAAAAELADALGRITEELRAGAHPASALAGVQADGPHARAVLGPAATAAALGDGVPAALAAQAECHPGVAGDVERVARAWALAERHGVPPVDLLATVVADMRWRMAHGRGVRAQLAGPRATAAVLTALPGLGVALGELIGAAPLAVLRSGVLGQVLVVVGVGLAAAGAAWTDRIIRVAART
jgi:tight adherence protein B